jgi:hypothetical protein
VEYHLHRPRHYHYPALADAPLDKTKKHSNIGDYTHRHNGGTCVMLHTLQDPQVVSCESSICALRIVRCYLKIKKREGEVSLSEVISLNVNVLPGKFSFNINIPTSPSLVVMASSFVLLLFLGASLQHIFFLFSSRPLAGASFLKLLNLSASFLFSYPGVCVCVFFLKGSLLPVALLDR